MLANYIEHVSDPWFTLIDLGLKTVEGRRYYGRFKDMQVGQVIQWININMGYRSVYTRITDLVVYQDLDSYLRTEGLNKCLPSIKTIGQGIDIYYGIYAPEDITATGMLAIRFELLHDEESSPISKS